MKNHIENLQKMIKRETLIIFTNSTQTNSIMLEDLLISKGIKQYENIEIDELDELEKELDKTKLTIMSNDFIENATNDEITFFNDARLT